MSQLKRLPSFIALSPFPEPHYLTFLNQPSSHIDHIFCASVLFFSISASLTFRYGIFSKHACCWFVLFTFELRNGPVSNGFSHSANHFYVFTGTAFPSPLLPTVSIVASPQWWESINLFHRKLNTHPHYITLTCNESGSDQHLEIHSNIDLHVYTRIKELTVKHKQWSSRTSRVSCVRHNISVLIHH